MEEDKKYNSFFGNVSTVKGMINPGLIISDYKPDNNAFKYTNMIESKPPHVNTKIRKNSPSYCNVSVWDTKTPSKNDETDEIRSLFGSISDK